MTSQEAINIIEDVTWQDNGRHYGKIAPAREIAISALEKQIPKKVEVTKYDIGGNNYFCSCGNKLRNGSEYCDKCGCKLDWSDTE